MPSKKVMFCVKQLAWMNTSIQRCWCVQAFILKLSNSSWSATYFRQYLNYYVNLVSLTGAHLFSLSPQLVPCTGKLRVLRTSRKSIQDQWNSHWFLVCLGEKFTRTTLLVLHVTILCQAERLPTCYQENDCKLSSTENYLFALSKKLFLGSKYPKKQLI